jgi:hypothetical protein
VTVIINRLYGPLDISHGELLLFTGIINILVQLLFPFAPANISPIQLQAPTSDEYLLVQRRLEQGRIIDTENRITMISLDHSIGFELSWFLKRILMGPIPFSKITSASLNEEVIDLYDRLWPLVLDWSMDGSFDKEQRDYCYRKLKGENGNRYALESDRFDQIQVALDLLESIHDKFKNIPLIQIEDG